MESINSSEPSEADGDDSPELDDNTPVLGDPVKPPDHTINFAEQLGLSVVHTAEGGIRFQHAYQAIEKNEYVPPPISDRAAARREAELSAGKARVAAAIESRRLQATPVKSAAEVAAEGNTQAVFRPNDVGADRPKTGLGPVIQAQQRRARARG